MIVHGKSAALEEVRQIPLCLPSDFLLATRQDGSKERACIEKELEDLAPGRTLGLNLGKVEFINFSFADECFVNLCGRLQAGEHLDRFVVLIAPKENLENELYDISVALKARKLAMLWLSDEEASECDVVGELSEALKETLRAVEPGDTNEVLAEKLNIKPTACINRTDKLTKMRLLRKKLHVGEYGYKQYEFAPVLPSHKQI